MSSPPSIDLVLSTLGRTDELRRFLASLAAQTDRGFRLILVDQNGDDRLDGLVAEFERSVPMIRLRTEERGLSRGRNLALDHVEGAVVGFPDDDCLYAPDLLARVAAAFGGRPDVDAVAGRTVDAAGRSSGLNWERNAVRVGRRNLFRCTMSSVLFFRRSLVEAVGLFDVSLGVGAGTPWGSGEETDYLLRALALGFRVEYDPALAIHHPGPRPAPADRAAMAKAYANGRGLSRVLQAHRYPRRYVAWRAAQLFAAAPVLALLGRPGQARYYLAMARGRAAGLVSGD